MTCTKVTTRFRQDRHDIIAKRNLCGGRGALESEIPGHDRDEKYQTKFQEKIQKQLPVPGLRSA